MYFEELLKDLPPKVAGQIKKYIRTFSLEIGCSQKVHMFLYEAQQFRLSSEVFSWNSDLWGSIRFTPRKVFF